jgi:hypothetical protein
MYTTAKLQEYLDEVREQVCSRCIERPPGGPPCLPLGKPCGVELHLSELVDAVHGVSSRLIKPYLERNRREICPHCLFEGGESCPCPMDYLPVLIVRAIETVDQRRQQTMAS